MVRAVREFFWFARMQVLTLFEYPVSLVMWAIAVFSWVFVLLIFWKVIFMNKETIAGWNFELIALSQAFIWTSFTLQDLFLAGVEEFHSEVVYGNLDRFLARPLNPVAALLGTHSRPQAIVNLVLAGILFFIGREAITIQNLGLGFLLCILGTVVWGLIVFSIGALSFWIGRANALYDLFCELFYTSMDYPVSVYPIWAKVFFSLIIPVGIIQTYPALISSGHGSFLQVIAAVVLLIMVWGLVDIWLWKGGLKRYGSAGG